VDLGRYGRLTALSALVVAAYVISPNAFATDPDGGSAPTFSGAPTGTPYAWAGTTPRDGVGVLVHDGRMRWSVDVAQCAGVVLPFSLHVTYDSKSDIDGYVGRGWFCLLDTKVTVNSGGDVTIVMEDGVARTWTKSGSSYTAPAGVLDVLTKQCTAGTYTRTGPDGFKFVYGTKLNSMQDRFGNTISFAYDGSGNPSSVTDSRGQTHSIGLWSGSGRLHTITTADGRAWAFQYDEHANLIDVIGPATATFPAGISYHFEYWTGASTDALRHNKQGENATRQTGPLRNSPGGPPNWINGGKTIQTRATRSMGRSWSPTR
jgi:YD repeat-containing protein